MEKRKKKKKKEKEKIMVKVASIKNIIKDLHQDNKKLCDGHARHHSLKHMRSMARLMKMEEKRLLLTSTHE